MRGPWLHGMAHDVAIGNGRYRILRPSGGSGMSTSAWTAGPWEWGADLSLWGPGGVKVIAHYGYEGMSFATFNDATDKANARLIVAAPDFAAAAASLIEAWDARTTRAQQIITGKSDADLQKQAMTAIDGLRAALKKAGAA